MLGWGIPCLACPEVFLAYPDGSTVWVMSSVCSGMDVPVSARRVCSVVPCDGSLESWTGTVCTDSNEFVMDFSKVQAVVQHNELIMLAAFYHVLHRLFCLVNCLALPPLFFSRMTSSSSRPVSFSPSCWTSCS